MSEVAPVAGCAGSVAAFLTALHRLPVAGLALPVEDANPSSWHADAARELSEVERGIEPGVLAACRNVVEAEPPPPSSGPRVLTHDDLFPEHVLVSSDGADVTGVLDWGDAALGDPAIDFFFAGFCGGDRFLEAVVERYGGEADNGLLARACDGARWMAAQYVIDGVRMERPEYLAQGIAALARLGLL
jgi:aminoglycoside phosphotransferase (APT) family kinase protein